jgi:hypothetical protein
VPGLEPHLYGPDRTEIANGDCHALFGGSGLVSILVSNLEGESYDLGNEQFMNTHLLTTDSAYLDISNKEGKNWKQHFRAPDSNAKHKQKRSRISKLRAEDEIASLFRTRRSVGRWRTDASTLYAKPKK